MATIFQTTFSNAYSWMQMYEFRWRFHWYLFLVVQLTIFQHWFRYWLVAGQATSHCLNQWWLIYWRIYAPLGLNELITQETSSWIIQMAAVLQWTRKCIYGQDRPEQRDCNWLIWLKHYQLSEYWLAYVIQLPCHACFIASYPIERCLACCAWYESSHKTHANTPENRDIWLEIKCYYCF